MRKILILSMSCDKGIFKNEESVISETWAKPVIEGKLKDVEFYFYKSCHNTKPRIDKVNHVIYVNAPDGLFDTWKKTLECLKLINSSDIEYDYIFRTNTSNVVNIGLLRAYVDSITDPMVIHGGELYRSRKKGHPTVKHVYARGNSMLFSKKVADILISYGSTVKQPNAYADDNMIGLIMNKYHESLNENYIKYIKCYGQAWYKCKNSSLGNGISKWNNSDDSYGYLRKFISIQIRGYNGRSNEPEKIRHISSVLANGHKENEEYSDVLKAIDKYSENPYIFVDGIYERLIPAKKENTPVVKKTIPKVTKKNNSKNDKIRKAPVRFLY